jgi:hypothetical protein
MRTSSNILRLSACLGSAVLLFVTSNVALAANDIQMLPPQDFAGIPCLNQNAGILYWDGKTPIKCIPGTAGDPNGNVTIGMGNLTVGGSLQVGANNAAYTSALAGTIRYNSSISDFEGCNGQKWKALNGLPDPDFDSNVVTVPCGSITTLTHNLGTTSFKLVEVTGVSPIGNIPTESYFNGSVDLVWSSPVSPANDWTTPKTYVSTYGWAWEVRPVDPNHAELWVADIDNADCSSHVKIWK